MTPKVEELQSHMEELNCFLIPSLEDVLGAMSAHYPYEEIFEQVIWKPILVLHSSGSTGNDWLIFIFKSQANLGTVQGPQKQLP